MIDPLTWLIIVPLASLGVYRVSRMVPKGEEGPFGITEFVYEWAFENQKKRLARGLMCYYCTSFWVSLAGAALISAPTWQLFVILWLGIAGLAAALYRKFD